MIVELLLLYWSLSIFLFFFPRLVQRTKLTHAKKIFFQKNKVIGVSHRGGMLENYDNSMSAFEHSVNNGIKMVEMDVYKTKDGKFVVAHDTGLTRITGQDILIKNVNYGEIRPYKDTVHCDYGLDLIRPNTKGERPPLLEDFLSFVQTNDVLVNLDVKTGKLEDIDTVLAMTKKAGLIHRVVIGAISDFDPDLFRKKYGDELNFFFPSKGVFMILIYFAIGLLPFISLKYDFYNIPFRFKTMENSNFVKDWKKTSYFLSVVYVLRHFFKLLMWHLQQRNIPITYFVANEEVDFELAINLGGNGLMTDRPKKLMDYLKAHKYC